MLTPIPPDVSDRWRGNIAQTARLLGVHRNTITRWVYEGRLVPKMRPDGRMSFTGKEVKRFWETH